MSTATNRSVQPDVRNPLTRLPSFANLASLPAESKSAMRLVLMDLRRDASAQAEKSWRKRKAPMAAYWKAVAVYAGHTARLLR